MATITKGYTFGATELVTNTKLHALVENASITNITDDDISTSANISDTKLAQITSTGKVNGSALTGLANIPSGAGNIPSANLGNAVLLSGNQTIEGVKTFSSIPILPSSDPTQANEAVRKAYVDTLFTGIWKKIFEANLSNANDYTVSDLDGDNDLFYMIILYGYFAANSADRIIGVRPNGATTNYGRGVQHAFERAGGTTFNNLVGWWGTTEAILPLGRNGWGADGYIQMTGFITAPTGMVRCIRSQSVFYKDGCTDYCIGLSATNAWLNTTTNITSLVFHFDGASDFDGKLIIFAMR